ncbi:MAG: alpha/beta hydrolase [Kofleriaceae bacterium]|nr:alpha/beta hydrolase [Kofleriaceae bacterium]
MQTTLQVQGIDVYVAGPNDAVATVVMIHGWPDTYRLWDAQVTALANTYRCVRFSLPGYEVSQPARPVTLDQMVALFGEIIDAVSPDAPVTLLLHDWGCVFGYQFAARHPQRVARVIGIDVGDTFAPSFVKSLSLKAKLMIGGYQGWLAMAHSLGRIGTGMTRMMARALRAPAPAASLGAQQNYPYVMQLSGGFRNAVSFAPHCPMLYFYGRNKPFMFHTQSWLDTIAARQGSAVHAMPTGHWVTIEQPVEFNRLLVDWLAQPTK